MTRHKVLWAVSLSNGETIYEEKGDYLELEGELSPWQRLLLHLQKNKLSIRSLFLYTDDGQRWNLPSLGSNPRFKAFDMAPKPITYLASRRIGFDFAGDEKTVAEIEKDRASDLFTIAEAIYSDMSLQIWVNEKNPKVSWVLAVPK